MQTFNSTSTSADQSNAFDAISKALLLKDLSHSVRIFFAHLVMWAWKNRRCWWSISAMASKFSVSERTIQRWTAELVDAGLVIVNHRPGRSNEIYPLVEGLTDDVGTGVTSCVSPIKETENKIERCTVEPTTVPSIQEPPPSPDPLEPENVNAFKISPESIPEPPPATPQPTQVQEPVSDHSSTPNTFGAHNEINSDSDQSPLVETAPTQPHRPIQIKPNPVTQNDLYLVEEIERATGDTWSKGHFLNLVRQHDEQLIWSALSVTKEKLALESGVNGGAYFTSTLRGMTGLQGLGSTPQPPTAPAPSPTPTQPEQRVHGKRTPIAEPEPEPIDPHTLGKGWKLLYKSGQVDAVLSNVSRCLPDWNPQRVWADLRKEQPDETEEVVLDQILELAALRLEMRATAGGSS